MKSLSKYISHIKDLHSLNEYLNEKLIVNKNFKDVSLSLKDYVHSQNLLVFMYKPNYKPDAYFSIIGISLDELGEPNKYGEQHLSGSSVTGAGSWTMDVKYDTNNQLVATNESINNNDGAYYIFIPVSYIKRDLNTFDNLFSFARYTPTDIDELFNIFTYEYIDNLNDKYSKMKYRLELSKTKIEEIKNFVDNNS